MQPAFIATVPVYSPDMPSWAANNAFGSLDTGSTQG